jgi:hypothetical protein
MKLKCALCSRVVEVSAVSIASGTIGGGRVYKGRCPEHGAFQDIIVAAQTEAGLHWDGSSAMLICPTCKREWPAEKPLKGRELGSAYRLFHGRCPDHGPLFHRGV